MKDALMGLGALRFGQFGRVVWPAALTSARAACRMEVAIGRALASRKPFPSTKDKPSGN